MSLFLDLLVIIFMVLAVVGGYKSGFFKSLMNLVTGVVSLLLAYTFSPALAVFFKEKFFLDKIASGIADTFASGSKTSLDAAQAAVYDLSRLLENPQFTKILERYGADVESITNFLRENTAIGYDGVEDIAKTVADPIATTVSTVCAFVLIFICAVIALKVFTLIVGALFKLPILKSADKALGLVFGVITALFIAWVVSLAAELAIEVMVAVAPSIVSENTFNNTFIIKFFAENSFIDIFSQLK